MLGACALPLLLAMGRPAGAQAPQDTDTAEEDELPPLVEEPVLTGFVEATYPEEAVAAGLEGSVILLLEIDEAGRVSHAEVLVSLSEDLDEAALSAARQLVFSPAEDAEGPVPVALEFEYGFSLQDEPEADPAGDDGATAAAPTPEADAAPVNLEGELLEMGTRLPLEGVLLVARPDGGEAVEALSDPQGRFSFRGLPSGEVLLEARYPGYRPAEVRVELGEGELTEARIWLRNLSYRDDEALIVYERDRPPEVTRRTLSIQEIRRVPGTFGDPVRVIQSLPGAARAPFGTGLLVIRGSNPEDSNVYIDGVEVPLIYHLGGYVSVVNADLIESVDYLPGTYGVRYGRSTGGVIDVQTKRDAPERPRFTWSTDALDSGGLLEGRFGRDQGLGLALGARRSYIDAIIPVFTGDSGFLLKPRWYDYQVKATARKLDRGSLSAMAFGFQDLLLLQTPADFAQGTDPDTQGDLSVRYQTHRQLVQLTRPLGEDLELRLQPAVGYDAIAFDVGSDFALVQRFCSVTLRAEAEWTASDALALTAGLDGALTNYGIEFALPFDPGTLADFDPLSEREDFRSEISGWFISPDPFVSGAWRPLGGSEDLLLLPGVRLNTLKIGTARGIVSVDPRLALRARLTEGGTLKAGTGLFQQQPQGQEFGIDADHLTVTFERAWSSELGWEQQLGPAVSVDLTGYTKVLDSLIVQNLDFTGVDETPLYVNDGIGRIHGLELMARHAPVDRFFGWLSYTLSRSERNDHPEEYGLEEGWYPFDFDQRHILVAVAGYQLPLDIGVSGRWQYVTGNPTTPYAGAANDLDQDSWSPYATGSWNSERLPPFYALDLRVDRLFAFKRWRLETYVDLLNVVKGENPEQVQYNYDYTESEYVSGLPFIPSPGFEAEILF